MKLFIQFIDPKPNWPNLWDWFILILCGALIMYIVLAALFYGIAKASQPKRDYLDKPIKKTYQTLASLPGPIIPPFRQSPINTKGGLSWVGYASWYSRASLVKEGTWKNGKERKMANGEIFRDDRLTAATRIFPLGSWLLVTNLNNGKTVKVKVTDRIGKRFAKTRIDLSKSAFMALADCKQGLIQVQIKRIK